MLLTFIDLIDLLGALVDDSLHEMGTAKGKVAWWGTLNDFTYLRLAAMRVIQSDVETGQSNLERFGSRHACETEDF